MESLVAKHVKTVVIANPAPKDWKYPAGRDPRTNTFCLRPQHIVSTAFLPEENPVRCILVAASIEGYLRREDGHKLLMETQEFPSFAADLLKAVKAHPQYFDI